MKILMITLLLIATSSLPAFATTSLVIEKSANEKVSGETYSASLTQVQNPGKFDAINIFAHLAGNPQEAVMVELDLSKENAPEKEAALLKSLFMNQIALTLTVNADDHSKITQSAGFTAVYVHNTEHIFVWNDRLKYSLPLSLFLQEMSAKIDACELMRNQIDSISRSLDEKIDLCLRYHLNDLGLTL